MRCYRLTRARDAREFLAVIGPNGSGKTTMLKTILDTASGAIIVLTATVVFLLGGHKSKPYGRE